MERNLERLNVEVAVFDMVDFRRYNEHSKEWENFCAVWMKTPSDEVLVYFGRVDRTFVQEVSPGWVGLIGCLLRETYPEQEHDEPPKGYDALPERQVVIRPLIGGYKISQAEQRRADRKAARLAKLYG